MKFCVLFSLLVIRAWAAPSTEAMADATRVYQEARYAEAVPLFQGLIAQAAASEDAALRAQLNLYLGEALRQCGKLEEALATLTSAHQTILANPECTTLRRVSAEALAKALSAAGRGEESDQIFTKTLATTPTEDHSPLRLTWAESAFQAGRHQIALRETRLAGKSAASLHLEGKIAHATGRYARASQLFREGFVLLSNSKETAELRGNLLAGLAAAACRQGNLPAAKESFAAAREAYAQCGAEAALKSLDKSEAVAALFLGHDPTASLPVLREAAAAYSSGDESGPAAAALSNLGAALHLAAFKTANMAERNELLHEARTCLDQAEPPLPLAHPLHRQIALNRWCLALDEGRMPEAAVAATRAADSALALLPDLLAAATEQERLAFRRLVDEISPLLHSAFADSKQVARAADVILSTHGAVLESELLALQAAALLTPAARDAWFAAREALGEAWFRPDTTQESLDTLRAEITRTATPRESLSVISSDRILKTLPHDSALVLYTLYQHYTGGGTFEPRYAALVLAPEKEPRIVALDYAADVSRQNKSLTLAISPEGIDDTAAKRSLAALGKSLWSPISTLLPAEAKRIFVCLDGTLDTIPLALLSDDGSTLIEKNAQLQFLATPRALLRGAASASEITTAETWLAVDAGSTWTGKSYEERNPQLAQILRHAGRDRLPNAAKEVAMIRTQHPQTIVLTNSYASESKCRSALSAAAEPRVQVWHFAGHGGLDSSAAPDPLGSDESWEGPLFPTALAKSGLLFPEMGDSTSDACLFAAEIALLDLRHIRLASFASCHSGAGLAAAREGIFDLARAGHAAGIRDVLVAAWGVSDEASPEFFRVFYHAISAGVNPPIAAWNAQAALWKSTRTELGFARAVLRSGPFRLVRSR